MYILFYKLLDAHQMATKWMMIIGQIDFWSSCINNYLETFEPFWKVYLSLLCFYDFTLCYRSTHTTLIILWRKFPYLHIPYSKPWENDIMMDKFCSKNSWTLAKIPFQDLIHIKALCVFHYKYCSIQVLFGCFHQNFYQTYRTISKLGDRAVWFYYCYGVPIKCTVSNYCTVRSQNEGSKTVNVSFL